LERQGARQGSKADCEPFVVVVVTLGQACTGVAMTSKLPGLLITVSLDKSLKIWNVRSGKPSLVCAKVKNRGGKKQLFVVP
jgi:hypothetical protein